MPDAKLHDKRQYLRVRLRGYGTLAAADDSWPAHLLNLSRSGALVAVLEPHCLAAGEAVSIEVELPSGGTMVMEGRVAHTKEHLLGLNCTPTTEADKACLEEVIGALAQLPA